MSRSIRVSASALLVGLVVSSLACSFAPGPARPSPPLAKVEAGQPSNGLQVLSAVTDRAAKAGAGPVTLVTTTIGSEGERAGAFIDPPKDVCLLLTAAGSQGVVDVDLFAFEDDGTAAGADESPQAYSAVLLCPPHADRLYLSARIVSGAGVLSVGMQTVPVEKAKAVASAAGARGGGEDSGRLDSWPGLEAKVHEHRALIGSKWDDVRRLAAPLDPRAPTKTTVPIDPGRCIDVLVTPSEEVSSLEVVAETEDGRIAARAQATGRDRWMVLCSQLGENVTVSMRPRVAQGLAALIVARSQPGAEAELERTTRVDRTTQSAVLADAKKALAAELDGKGFGPAKEVGKGDAKVGSRVGVDLKLPKGCSRIDAIAGTPLGPVKASLWDDKGALLAEGEGGVRATLYACSTGGDARLDVEADVRPGPFSVELRPFKATLDPLVAHPLAASRLLGRLESQGIDPTKTEGVHPITLTHDALAKETLVVKEGTCREVFTALDKKGSGLELRLIDDATKTDSLSRSRFVASDRICANKSARRITAEMRLSNADGTALVFTRETTPD